ncbi:hypothetical protein [Cryocola sp. 340MFSha3.1]|uniref:hypothetical protein n=1 Tax=Cryocola sp. 340MFSha3.1 TaxID=1169145 RepID=UPI00036F3F0B|nr:hypothetical protein [Cryocola sp. 340MFSha3.1]
MTEFRGKVRDRDPEPSWDAAELQTEDRVARVQAGILAVLMNHPTGLSDEQIVDHYEAQRFLHPSLPNVTAQSLRTRRKALQVEGRVRATGRRVPTRHGATAAVWVACSPEQKDAPAARPGQ